MCLLISNITIVSVAFAHVYLFAKGKVNSVIYKIKSVYLSSLSMKKTVYIIIGSLSLLLGVIGIFVPGLPTTPFVLLSSWLFYRSSEKMHRWLVGSRLGVYVNRYEKRGGMGRTAKIVALCTMWVMVNISAFVAFESTQMRIILYILGLIGTCCVIFLVPSAKKEKDN